MPFIITLCFWKSLGDSMIRYRFTASNFDLFFSQGRLLQKSCCFHHVSMNGDLWPFTFDLRHSRQIQVNLHPKRRCKRSFASKVTVRIHRQTHAQRTDYSTAPLKWSVKLRLTTHHWQKDNIELLRHEHRCYSTSRCPSLSVWVFDDCLSVSWGRWF